MKSYRTQFAAQHRALTAPTAERLGLRLTLNDTHLPPYPVRYRHPAASPADRRLP